MLVLLAGGWIGINYYFFYVKSVKATIELSFWNILLTGIIVYLVYLGAKRLRANDPVLTFTRSDLTINIKGDPESFLWVQITEWEIGRDDQLLIKTVDTQRSVSLTMLEKKPKEIKELMEEYSGRKTHL